MMDRRRFIVTTVCMHALGLSRTASSASGSGTVGLLWVASAGSEKHIAMVREAVKAQGVDLAGLRFERAGLVDRYEALEPAAQALVKQRPDVILTYGSTSLAAARRASTSVPIVIIMTTDPVKLRVADSLSRPGQNVTGIRLNPSELTGKRLEFLKRIAPRARRLAHIFNSESATEVAALDSVGQQGRAVGFEMDPLPVRHVDDIEPAIERAAKAGTDGFTFASSTMLVANAPRVVQAIAKTRRPAIYPNSEYAEAGGIVSYGPNLLEGFRLAGGYIGRILKGARPADMPIEQSNRYELVVNPGAARAQGIAIPLDVLGLADRLVET